MQFVPALLLVLFVALKLTGVIAWSWLWVLSPAWIGLAIALLFWLGSMLFIGITFYKHWR